MTTAPTRARLYECRISHARTVPLRNVFSYGTYLWLVDLDRLPRPGPLTRFSARDHLGDPDRGIRENLDRFLATRGVDLGGGRVLMLAHARVLGYVFNPLTVYWCHRADGALACVVAEVHNTYRERHAYLLRTDERGRTEVPKEFYVSPFYPVDGRYRMSLPEPGDRLALTVTLVLQGLTFAVALKLGKHSVVDTAWGIGIALAALTAFLTSINHGQNERRYLILAASLLWGLRLAAYVGWRNHGKPEDPRYQDMLDRATGSRNLYALRMIYLLQAAILWLATVPVQAGMLERAPAGALAIAGAVLFAVGFFFESAGDWQLYRFKADPANKGQVMDRGLWRYTRHPNYFGDFCMWWGLFAISYGSWQELPALVAPLLMTFILTRGTGAALTDRRMKASRPGYAEYVERTSGFIPLPPKRVPKRRAAGAVPPGRG